VKWNEWYANFFDKDLIGSLVPTEVSQQEIGILKKLLKGDTVLDLGCGVGRFSLVLAKFGYKVYALDVNKLYLRVLKYEAKRMGVEKNIKILCLDMRSLNQLNVLFDNILLTFNTFGYFTHRENIRLIKDIARKLRPKGRLIISQSSFDFVKSNLKDRDWFEDHKFLFLSENRWRIFKDRIIIYTKWRIVDKNSKKVKEKFQRITIYKPSKLVEICKNYGLKLLWKKRIGNMEWFCFYLPRATI